MHQAAQEIAYLCGARQQYVLRLHDYKPLGAKADDCYVTDEGIVIWQAKTGKVQLKKFTPRLNNAVELARKYKAELTKGGKPKKRASSPWLICTKTGSKFTRGGFNSSWTKTQRDAIEK